MIFRSRVMSSGVVCSGDGADNPSTTNAVPVMTSNTAPSGITSASSELSSVYYAYKAFDSADTSWVTNAISSGWLQYMFATAKVVNKYTIQSQATVARSPKNWTIQASNTGAFAGEQVTLATVTNQTAWTNAEVRTFTFINSTSYLYYRINITANNGDTYLAIYEMKLIETQC